MCQQGPWLFVLLPGELGQTQSQSAVGRALWFHPLRTLRGSGAPWAPVALPEFYLPLLSSLDLTSALSFRYTVFLAGLLAAWSIAVLVIAVGARVHLVATCWCPAPTIDSGGLEPCHEMRPVLCLFLKTESCQASAREKLHQRARQCGYWHSRLQRCCPFL